ncbi:MAG: T9SS type A sorting domain-containing protein [Saprospiraceae bacterium]|nr:T9SS type A sorting domain-containing protein [Saprospiraceae bacterium]
MLTIVHLTSTLSAIRKIVILLPGVILLSISGHTQGLSTLWTRQISISPYNLHGPEGKITMVGTDEDGKTVFGSMADDGTGISYTPLPEVSLLGSSLYDPAENCYYVMGTNENIDQMQLVKYQANGAVVWQKNYPFSGYRFPYQIVKQGNSLAFTFGQISIQGVSTGFGWWLLDPTGQLLSENVHIIPQTSSLILPYASTFTPSGQLIITTSDLESGEGAVYALNPVSGALSWSRTIPLPALSSIQNVYADAANDIFLTGEYGFFVRLNTSGEIVFQKQIGYSPVSAAYNILEKNGDLYLIGGWRENINAIETKARVLVIKCNPEDGSEAWTWTYDHTGADDGPVATHGFFRNDSTLVLHFSRGFSSEWIGAFRLNGTVGVPEPEIQPLSFSPNPSVNGLLNLQGINQVGKLRIYTSLGQLVWDADYQPGTTVQLLQKGTYWVHFEAGDKRFIGKWIHE